MIESAQTDDFLDLDKNEYESDEEILFKDQIKNGTYGAPKRF